MFIGFTGTLGSGKTLSMTFWGRYFATKLKMPVWANYELKGNWGHKISDWDTLTKISNGIVLLDELHITFDSRLWSNTAKRTHFLLQTRKKNMLVMFTTQHISQVDKRIRNICDFMIICEKAGDFIKNHIVKYQGGELGRIIKLQNISKIYDWYNTYEIVKFIK